MYGEAPKYKQIATGIRLYEGDLPPEIAAKGAASKGKTPLSGKAGKRGAKGGKSYMPWILGGSVIVGLGVLLFILRKRAAEKK